MIYSAPPTDARQLRWLWFGLLAGPLVWGVYFLGGYGLTEFVCKLGLLKFRILGLPALSATIVGLTMAALLVTLYAGFLAYRNWQQVAAVEPGEGQPNRLEENSQFMTLAGVLLNGLFALTILLTGLPAFFLPSC
ncbi:MAG TPA: hypothetical protein VEC93_05985 [Anaerolineae bacterium]|jgi:hypothetical protein|nr:hypothetical protein [Anaerolineae bacterium]